MAEIFPTAEAAENAELRRVGQTEERAGTQLHEAFPPDPDDDTSFLVSFPDAMDAGAM